MTKDYTLLETIEGTKAYPDTDMVDRVIGQKVALQKIPLTEGQRIWYTSQDTIYAAYIEWNEDSLTTETHSLTDWVYQKFTGQQVLSTVSIKDDMLFYQIRFDANGQSVQNLYT